MPWSKLRSLFDGGRPKKANVSETPNEDPRGGDGDDEEEDEWVEKTFERDVALYEITFHWIDGDDETVLSYGIDEETEEYIKLREGVEIGWQNGGIFPDHTFDLGKYSKAYFRKDPTVEHIGGEKWEFTYEINWRSRGRPRRLVGEERVDRLTKPGYEDDYNHE